MKIAIITRPLRTNYGGILQNYALSTVLHRMGHTTITLQRNEFKEPKYPRFLISLTKRLILKVLGKYKYPIFTEKQYIKDYPVFTQNTLGFVSRHIKTKIVDYANPQIKESDFDAYVVGSDQVWRPSYNDIGFTFLRFTTDWDVKRCAYAASFGTDEWEFSSSDTDMCKALATKFDSISVREASGVNLCKNYLGVKAEHVLDPTLLLQRVDYEKLIDEVETEPSAGQILVHILDKNPDKYKLVDMLAKPNNWKPFEVNCKVDEHEVNVPIKLRIQPPLEQWLRGFREAEFIITDSFHATVFSIIFNKPFVVYANKGRGAARFMSLLSLFGLEDRLIFKSKDLEGLTLNSIDYDRVNKKIDYLRSKSLVFLKNIFEN